MPSKHMHRGLVALSASAVAAVYMVGYLRTQSADASIGAADIPTPSPAAVSSQVGATVTAPTATPVPVAVVTRGSTSAPQPTATAVRATAPTSGAYKDGTYTGQGTSRRGGVVVSVAVQGGHIASVTITQSTLQYPLRDIASLPGEVVQRQSAQVDTVSRATYSSQAFRAAVAQALAKAA